MISVKLLGVIAFGVVVGVGAVVNAIWGPRARARRRLARGTQGLAEGEVVTVVGKVRQLGEVITSPLSGRACVAYDAVGSMPNDGYQVHERTLATFEVVTTDGAVLVEKTDELDFALPIIPIIPRKLGLEQAFLELRGHDPRDAARMTFEEAIVEVGDKILVQGVAVRDAVEQGERGYRDAPTRLRLVPHANHPLTIGKP